jgi:HEAT repeat protein
MPDYLEQASSVIFGNKVSLTDLVESDHHQVVGNLLHVLEKSRGELQAMRRKAAAYALGQIGEPRSMKQLREYFEREPADGVRDAMLASMTAIKLAPTPTHSQLERRKIIGDVYKRRRNADWS